MKYVVDVNGARHIVSLDGGAATLDETRVEARLEAADASPTRIIRIGDRVQRVVVRRGEVRGRYTLWIDGHRHEVDALDERTRAIQDLAAAASGPRGPAPLVAPMPGLIVRVNVAPGQQIAAGTGLVVMEAMKMENELRAPAGGTVKAVHVTAGQAVEKGALLVELE